MAPTYRDLGNGLVEVDVGGKPARMRMSSEALDLAGYQRVDSGFGVSAPAPMSMAPPPAANPVGLSGIGVRTDVPIEPVAPLPSPRLELSTSPIGVQTGKSTPVPSGETGQIQTLFGGPAGATNVFAPQMSTVERLGRATMPTERQPFAESKQIEQIAKTSGWGNVTPVADESPADQVRRIQLEAAAGKPRTKITAMPAPEPQGEGQGRGGSLPFVVPGGGGGGGPARPRGLVEKERQLEGIQYAPGALENWAAAKMAQAKAQVAGYSQMAQEYQAQAVRLREEAAAQDSVGAQRRAKYNEALANWAKDAADVNAMKVDPNKFWHDRGAFAGLLGALSMAVGAYAATIGHRADNPAMSLLESAVDREIDAQKASIQARQHGLQTQMTLLDRYLQVNDPEAATALARATLKESVAANLQGKEALARAGQIHESAQADIADVMLKAGERKVKTTMGQPPMVGGGVGSRVPIDPNMLVKAGMDPQMAMYVAQNNPEYARKIQSQFLESGAAAAGKGSGTTGGRPYSSRTMTKVAMAEAALNANARLVKAFTEHPWKSMLEIQKEGTPTRALADRVVFNQTHVSSAGPSAENIKLLRDELFTPGVVGMAYGPSHVLNRLENNRKEIQDELDIYNGKRQGTPSGKYSFEGSTQLDDMLDEAEAGK